MPEYRTFRGREVKNAKRMRVGGRSIIRITFVGQKGQPGQQTDITPEEYEAGVVRTFKPGKSLRT